MDDSTPSFSMGCDGLGVSDFSPTPVAAGAGCLLLKRDGRLGPIAQVCGSSAVAGASCKGDRMMKKVLVALLLVWLVLPVAVHAGPPTDVEGDFVYIPAIVGVRQAGDNLFLDATDTATWTGAFVGTSTEEYVAVLHGITGIFGTADFAYEMGFYKGTVTFTGEVEGRSGTVEILFLGKSPGDPERLLADWTGTWRIISGTDELANLNGTGVFWNNAPMDIHYKGQIHFDPPA